MNALDYILDAVLLATIFLQFRGRRLTVRYLVLSVAIVVYFLFAYLKGVPTAGNDLYLIAGGVALGLIFGVGAGAFTRVYPRRGADVADPRLKVGVAETVEDGRDHRAGRAQAPAAGAMLLPRRRLSGSHVTGRQPGLARRVPPVQPDVRHQALLGEHLPRHALRGRGGIRRGSVQKHASLSRGNGDTLTCAAAQQVANRISEYRLPGGQPATGGQAHPPFLIHVASLCQPHAPGTSPPCARHLPAYRIRSRQPPASGTLVPRCGGRRALSCPTARARRVRSGGSDLRRLSSTSPIWMGCRNLDGRPATRNPL
jgi:hypothetical protein